MLFFNLKSFHTIHYAGEDMRQEVRDGEPWKKVYGPVFVCLNSVPESGDPNSLCADAKHQVILIGKKIQRKKLL